MKSRTKSCMTFFGSQVNELTAVDVKNHKISYAYALLILVMSAVAKVEGANHTSSFMVLTAALIAMLGARQQVANSSHKVASDISDEQLEFYSAEEKKLK